MTSITLFLQCLTRLSSRIIELTGLTDNDRPRADDQDAVDVGSLGHAFAYPSAVFCLATLRLREFACMRLTMRYMKCSNSRRRSCGPGAGLRMPLKAEGRPVGARDPLQRAVEQRPVRGAQRLRQGRFIDRESVVLRGNRRPARIDLHHRVVGADDVENFILTVFAPLARPRSWWPRQMPKTGMSVSRKRAMAAIA